MRATTRATLICVLFSCPALAETGRETLENAAKALGASVNTLQYAGTGSAFTLGQNVSPTAPWPKVTLKAYSRSIDYSSPGYLEESVRITPGGEQRQAQVVRGNHAWNIGGAGVVPAPAALHERLTQIWLTPHGFLKAALSANATVRHRREGGRSVFEVSFTGPTRTKMHGIIVEGGGVMRTETWIDNPVLGSMLVTTDFGDYKDFGAVKFPTRIVQRQGGHPTLELTITGVNANAPFSIDVPPPVQTATAPPVRVDSQKLSDGVWYLAGGTHHSLLVEFRDHLLVIEGPQNEERAQAVIAEVKRLVPGKPLRYVVNTHHHFDHSGGLRHFAAQGVTIVTHEINKPYYSRVLKAKFQTLRDKRVFTDGSRTVELHLIQGNSHSDGILMAYLPKERMLVEADVYTPPAPNAAPPSPPNPAAVNLYENIQRLRLDVDVILPIHGRPVPLAELRRAVGK